jgi:spoIIIJ-associated protein
MSDENEVVDDMSDENEVAGDENEVADEGWDDSDDFDDENGEEAASDEAAADSQDEPSETAEHAGDDRSEAERAEGDAKSDDEGGLRRRRPRRRQAGRAEPPPPADERARLALQFVTDVIHEMEMECRVKLRRPRDGNSEDEINIEILGRDAGRIIGKKGQVLQALQFLTHRVVNRPGAERRHVMVDAEGYRSRRDNSLASMARRLGKQAVDEGKIITFEPMNPRDRRVVHLALAKFEGVITKSDGEGDERRVQIIPVRR